MSWRGWRWIPVGVVGLGLVVGEAMGEERVKVKWTVGKDTTVVTEPLLEDGRVDYVAALNRRYGEGVRAEENVVAGLVEILGPEAIDAKVRAKYLGMLGVKELVEKGEYFVIPGEAGVTDDEVGTAVKGPWKRGEHEAVAKWLERNKGALDRIRAVAERVKYYNPLIPDAANGTLASADVIGAKETRALMNAAMARAMWELGEGDSKGFGADAVATARVGWSMRKGGIVMLESLAGIYLCDTVDRGVAVGAGTERWEARECREFLATLEGLPGGNGVAERGDVCERWALLDAVQSTAYGKTEAWRKLLGMGGVAPDVAQVEVEKVDWDVTLREVQGYSDRRVAVLRERDRRRIDAGGLAWEREQVAWAMARDDGDAGGRMRVGESERAYSRRVAGMILVPWGSDLGHCRILELQEEMRFGLMRVALGLGAYKADVGQYPARLAALVEKGYLKEVPGDVFSGKELVYKTNGEWIVVYSVGPDGVDDGGAELKNRKGDLVVRGGVFGAKVDK